MPDVNAQSQTSLGGEQPLQSTGDKLPPPDPWEDAGYWDPLRVSQHFGSMGPAPKDWGFGSAKPPTIEEELARAYASLTSVPEDEARPLVDQQWDKERAALAEAKRLIRDWVTHGCVHGIKPDDELIEANGRGTYNDAVSYARQALGRIRSWGKHQYNAFEQLVAYQAQKMQPDITLGELGQLNLESLLTSAILMTDFNPDWFIESGDVRLVADAATEALEALVQLSGWRESPAPNQRRSSRFASPVLRSATYMHRILNLALQQVRA